jgi:hypothetical protein
VVRISSGYCERVNEQVIDGDTLEMGRIGSLLWDAVVLWLVPFVVKHKDIRLVSIKD